MTPDERQDAYREQRREYIAALVAAKLIPTLTPWPKRRSSKCRPIPGIWPQDDSEG